MYIGAKEKLYRISIEKRFLFRLSQSSFLHMKWCESYHRESEMLHEAVTKNPIIIRISDRSDSGARDFW